MTNDQLLSRSDVVIAMIWHDIGSPTNNSPSGTIEEIDRADASKIPVHIFFKNSDIAIDSDISKLEAVQKFEESVRKRAFYKEFDDLSDLKLLVSKVLDQESERLSVERGIVNILESDAGTTERPLPISWSRSDSLASILVHNPFDSAIENLRVSMSAGRGLVPTPTESDRVLPLAPAEGWRVLCHVPAVVADKFDITITGLVDGKEFSQTTPVESD